MNLNRILISISIILIVSLLLKIELQHCLVIVIISSIVLFIMTIRENEKNEKNLFLINKLNNKKFVNNIILKSENLKPENLKPENLKPNNLNKTEDNIIEPHMYNLDDCTTDMTCIQKPDNINLFPKKKSKKIDGIVVENFISSTNPFQMNDVSTPFNSVVIDPFEHYSTIKNESIDNNEELGIHVRVGNCLGGICKGNNKIPESLVGTENKYLQSHPYSDNQATIRVSNPDYSI